MSAQRVSRNPDAFQMTLAWKKMSVMTGGAYMGVVTNKLIMVH